ncbi:MAG: hypothetical protein PHG35_02055 [Dehalococcoidales bacterium]|nr:hypothetical protein [Dehalococcoidales bacterium]
MDSLQAIIENMADSLQKIKGQLGTASPAELERFRGIIRDIRAWENAAMMGMSRVGNLVIEVEAEIEKRSKGMNTKTTV